MILSDKENMEVQRIFRFERLRDGGSLIVSFQADDSCEYWVMFPIANFDLEKPRFKKPVLINRTTDKEISLSLDSAKQWLIKLDPYFNQRPALPHVAKESEAGIFNEMLALCQSKT